MDPPDSAYRRHPTRTRKSSTVPTRVAGNLRDSVSLSRPHIFTCWFGTCGAPRWGFVSRAGEETPLRSHPAAETRTPPSMHLANAIPFQIRYYRRRVEL
ncbi:uncharacterized protein J3R85_013466 [Psidium guajava]|nr:uncharacterized protein J3R85_013466 [Psidium guajava]